MRYAVIDVGSNTVKLLVADYRDDDLHPLLEDAVTTRIGQDVARNRRLLPEAIERTILAVREFIERAKAFHPEHFLACATSAVRDSANRNEFLRTFREAAGFECGVLTGDEEAELIFRGVCSARNFRDREVVVFDIGGGSIEFIRGRRGRIEFKTSLDHGAVRLTEMFLKSDPPVREELDALRNRLSVLHDLHSHISHSESTPLLGTGGTISSLAAMELGLTRPVSAQIDGYSFSLPRLREIADQLGQTSLEQRKQLRGLNPQRADIIVAGAITLAAGVEELGWNTITVSTRNLRHGAIIKHVSCS